MIKRHELKVILLIIGIIAASFVAGISLSVLTAGHDSSTTDSETSIQTIPYAEYDTEGFTFL